MKVYLLYKDRDFSVPGQLTWHEEALVQDLELDILFQAMANRSSFIFDVVRGVVLSSLKDPEAIVYRQDVLRDCLEQPSVVTEMYRLAGQAIGGEKRVWRSFTKAPETILHRSIEVLEMFVGLLRRLRGFADEPAEGFRSPGFTSFFDRLRAELDEGYFASVEEHLSRLRFRSGVLISAQLGEGNKGTDYTLRASEEAKLPWTERIRGRGPEAYSFAISERDEAGARALSVLRSRGINLVADAVARSVDHIVSFFQALQTELAFYIGCMNLKTWLAQNEAPMCYPTPVGPGPGAMSFDELYDASLSLALEGRAVGNEARADKKPLVMITGPNQGGKSTFLRSVGLAVLMMQSGMFVAARTFRATVCSGVFTHFKREEDATMESGKLDEELRRMSDIADAISPNCILLCNESFAATNEREGSEIARQVVAALLEAGVRVFFVTHFFDLAEGFYRQHAEGALFLRADRRPDGSRTFRLVEGAPLATSHAEDLYERVFGGGGFAVARAS